MRKPLRMFISYAREDSTSAARLASELKRLIALDHIEIWQDVFLQAGQRYAKVIKAQIASADMFVVLVSRDYLRSAFCRQELRDAKSRFLAGKCKIFPILLTGAPGWEKISIGRSQLGSLQAIPGSGRPIDAWQNENHAWQIVAEEVADIVGDVANPPAELKRALAPLCSFVMDSIHWRFDLEKWNHYYTGEDQEAEDGLYGEVQAQREGNSIKLLGWTPDFGKLETTAIIKCDPFIAQFEYRSKTPIDRVRSRSILKFSKSSEVVVANTYADFGMTEGHPNLSLTDFIDFLVQTFRKQKLEVRRGAARRGRS